MQHNSKSECGHGNNIIRSCWTCHGQTRNYIGLSTALPYCTVIKSESTYGYLYKSPGQSLRWFDRTYVTHVLMCRRLRDERGMSTLQGWHTSTSYVECNRGGKFQVGTDNHRHYASTLHLVFYFMQSYSNSLPLLHLHIHFERKGIRRFAVVTDDPNSDWFSVVPTTDVVPCTWYY